jgi:hypothetical protein
MPQKINFRLSGRKDISNSDFEFEIIKNPHSETGPPILRVTGVNKSNEVCDDALIVVRLKELRDYRNFECGTVSSPQSPPPDALSDFVRESYQLSFRIIGVSGANKGKILGSSTEKKFVVGEVPTANAGLLPLTSEDLGSLLWKLHVDDDGPRVVVNSKVPGIRAKFKDDKLMLSAIFPIIIRDVLNDVYKDGYAPPFLPSWKENWHDWATQFNDRNLPSVGDLSGIKEWLDDAVDNFMEKHAFIEKLIQDAEGEE